MIMSFLGLYVEFIKWLVNDFIIHPSYLILWMTRRFPEPYIPPLVFTREIPPLIYPHKKSESSKRRQSIYEYSV